MPHQNTCSNCQQTCNTSEKRQEKVTQDSKFCPVCLGHLRTKRGKGDKEPPEYVFGWKAKGKANQDRPLYVFGWGADDAVKQDNISAVKSIKGTVLQENSLAERKSMKGRLAQRRSVDPAISLCSRQHSEFLFWCNSCFYKVCGKCLIYHKQCDWCPIEDRCQFLQSQGDIFTARTKDRIIAIGNTLLEECQAKLTNLYKLVEHCKTILNYFEQNTNDIIAKQKSALKEYEELHQRYLGVRECNEVSKLTEVTRSLQLLSVKNPPAPLDHLLVHVANAYLDSPNANADVFVNKLHQSIKSDAVEADDPSSLSDQSDTASGTSSNGMTYYISPEDAVAEARINQDTPSKLSDSENIVKIDKFTAVESNLQSIVNTIQELKQEREVLKVFVTDLQENNEHLNHEGLKLQEHFNLTKGKLNLNTMICEQAVTALTVALVTTNNSSDQTCPLHQLRTIIADRDSSLWLKMAYDQPSCALQVAMATKKKDWVVETAWQAETAASLLPYAHPASIAVETPSSVVAGSEVKKLLATVKSLYVVDLKLCLRHSYVTYSPCDDLLMELKGASCDLTEVRCCVETEAAVKVLAALECTGREMRFSVPDALQHLHLSHWQAELDLTVRLCPCPAGPNERPLPEGCSLTVDGVPQSGLEDVATLLQALGPLSNRYQELYLQQCSLADADLLQLVVRLQRAGLRTVCPGGTYWLAVEMYKDTGNCDICEKREHLRDQRCLQLHLSDDLPNDQQVDGMNFVTESDEMTSLL